VNVLTPEAEKFWQAEVDKVAPRIRGEIVPEDMFDIVQTALKEFRARK
jgi:hypothetical protein